jgi:hypothetical protein
MGCAFDAPGLNAGLQLMPRLHPLPVADHTESISINMACMPFMHAVMYHCAVCMLLLQFWIQHCNATPVGSLHA